MGKNLTVEDIARMSLVKVEKNHFLVVEEKKLNSIEDGMSSQYTISLQAMILENENLFYSRRTIEDFISLHETRTNLLNILSTYEETFEERTRILLQSISDFELIKEDKDIPEINSILGEIFYEIAHFQDWEEESQLIFFENSINSYKDVILNKDNNYIHTYRLLGDAYQGAAEFCSNFEKLEGKTIGYLEKALEAYRTYDTDCMDQGSGPFVDMLYAKSKAMLADETKDDSKKKDLFESAIRDLEVLMDRIEDPVMIFELAGNTLHSYSDCVEKDIQKKYLLEEAIEYLEKAYNLNPIEEIKETIYVITDELHDL